MREADATERSDDQETGTGEKPKRTFAQNAKDLATGTGLFTLGAVMWAIPGLPGGMIPMSIGSVYILRTTETGQRWLARRMEINPSFREFIEKQADPKTALLGEGVPFGKEMSAAFKELAEMGSRDKLPPGFDRERDRWKSLESVSDGVCNIANGLWHTSKPLLVPVTGATARVVGGPLGAAASWASERIEGPPWLDNAAKGTAGALTGLDRWGQGLLTVSVETVRDPAKFVNVAGETVQGVGGLFQGVGQMGAGVGLMVADGVVAAGKVVKVDMSGPVEAVKQRLTRQPEGAKQTDEAFIIAPDTTNWSMTARPARREAQVAIDTRPRDRAAAAVPVDAAALVMAERSAARR